MNGRFSFCSTPTGDSPAVPCQREFFPLFHAIGRFSHCSMQREILLLFHANGRFSYCSMPTGDSSTILFHANGRFFYYTVPCQWEILFSHWLFHANGRLDSVTVPYPCQREIILKCKRKIILPCERELAYTTTCNGALTPSRTLAGFQSRPLRPDHWYEQTA